jgi:hypothetical protein
MKQSQNNFYSELKVMSLMEQYFNQQLIEVE